MSSTLDVFEEMKAFVQFDAADEANLKALAPVFARRGQAITDGFYARLGQFEETARQIEGRVEALKATHTQWMNELFVGVYDHTYFNNRLRIGKAHVRIGLSPQWVEGVMSYLRAAAVDAIAAEVEDPAAQAARYKSLCKLLDLDLMLINVAYGEERLERLTAFTGMSRKLIERCISKGA